MKRWMRRFFLGLFVLMLLQGFLFSEEAVKPRLAIFAFQVAGMEPWDPSSVKSGINGSEEAVIYIGDRLANLGYEVTVFADPPQDSIYSKPEANPRYVRADSKIEEKFDVGIVWRDPYNGSRYKSRADHIYLWPHDTLSSSVSQEQINAFTGVLWLSEWQRDQFASISPGFANFRPVFGNGINPEHFQPIKPRSNPHSCIYGSNYARGLNMLLDMWPLVKKQFPDATLDIYYGWRHWGLLSPQQEAYMRRQVMELAILGVRDHGQVGHEELNRAFENASIWAYPCTAPETFCITALRAELAGALPVIIEGTALKETVPFGLKCSAPCNPQTYLNLLLNGMKRAESLTVQERSKMGEFVLKEYTWEAVAKKWKKLFDQQE